MKTLLLFTLLSILLFSCEPGLLKDGTNQEIRKVSIILSPSGTAVVTYVWHDGNIICSWYDDIKSVTDSTVKERQRQGDSALIAFKKLQSELKLN